MAKNGCRDCREICLTQSRCANCNGKTERAIVMITDAPGGPGNSGPGAFSGWRCKRCQFLWDGGAAYGFACLAHGGHEAKTPEGSREIQPETPMGDD